MVVLLQYSDQSRIPTISDSEIQSIAEADPDYSPGGCGFSCGPDSRGGNYSDVGDGYSFLVPTGVALRAGIGKYKRFPIALKLAGAGWSAPLSNLFQLKMLPVIVTNPTRQRAENFLDFQVFGVVNLDRNFGSGNVIAAQNDG